MLDRDPIYPSSPSPRSFTDGIEFQDWVCERLAREGIILHVPLAVARDIAAKVIRSTEAA